MSESLPERGSPKVFTDMREPLSVQMESMSLTPTGPRVPNLLPTADDGRTVYMSTSARYRVQITAPKSFMGLDGIKTSGGQMLYAQFEDGRYKNHGRDAEEIALIDRQLQRNKYFGKFGGGPLVHYWLANDQREKTEKARKENAIKTLKTMPREELEQALSELKAGEAVDHELPPPKEASQARRPIAGR